jgi:hypothetical protein
LAVKIGGYLLHPLVIMVLFCVSGVFTAEEIDGAGGK